jgi:hypothetical protein
MHSTIAAQIWEIWSRRRTSIRLAVGISAAGGLVNWILPESIHMSEEARILVELLAFHAGAAVLLLTLAIFSYTEVNPQNGSAGFPQRLFALPVSSFQLVAVPMLLGVVGMEIVALAWMAFAARPGDRSPTVPLTLGVYMVLFQTILWTLPRLRTMRMLVLGLSGVTMIMMPIFPFVRRLSRVEYASWLVGLAFAAFLTSWIYVARQRSGGSGFNLSWVKSLAWPEWNRLPRRDRIFSSAQSAQFWYEWRRCGLVLPLFVGSLFAVIIGPLSWSFRNDGSDSLRILVAILAMPPILALAIGKAFSRPDFWSGELNIPGFIAVRPLSTVDMVAIKIKVAAVSTIVSWTLVLAFLTLWLSSWANLDSIALIRGVLWEIHGHSVYPQYAIAVLGVVALMSLTWGFLIGDLWLGLSGNNKVFALSAIPYVIVPVFAVPGLLIGLRFQESVLGWLYDKVGPFSTIFFWVAVAAVIAKFWVAAFAWRGVSSQHVRRYLAVWAGGTICLVVFAIFLWGVLGSILPSDSYRLRNSLILLAMLTLPLARIGLAPTFLARNRHR